MLQDDNMNPHDIYLQHCRQFAKSNFDLQSLNIETYKIKFKDVSDNIFYRENNQHMEYNQDEANEDKVKKMLSKLKNELKEKVD